MSPWVASAPDPDPYFDAPADKATDANAKFLLGKDEHVRGDLLSTEEAFRLAGRVGMVLGALVFVTFGIPVSSMLRHAGDPGGILLDEPWLRDRWVARMTTTLTLAAVGTFVSWGLARRKRWARWTWTAIASLTIVALVLFTRAEGPGILEPAVSDLICVSATCLPGFGLVLWRLWSRRGRAVFSRDYEAVVARTPSLTSKSSASLWPGLTLALAMLVLFWALDLVILCTLVVCQVIRSL